MLESKQTNQRFTSYDRSTVASLDYAVNRSYSSGQGRFTSVDPIGMSSSSASNPQSLNLYAYVENNPIDYTDPSGLDGDVLGVVTISPGEIGGGVEMWMWGILMNSFFSRPMVDVPLYNNPETFVVDIVADPDPVTTNESQSICGMFNQLNIPEGVSIETNASIARSHAFASALEYALSPVGSAIKDGINANWFYNQVRGAAGRIDDVKSGKSWDYKQLGAKYEKFGNFNFGLAGAAMGWALRTLQREAGRSNLASAGEKRKQMEEKWGTPGNRLDPNGGTKSFGDDPNDQKWIETGFLYYQNNCGNIKGG